MASPSESKGFDSIPEAIQAFRDGQFIVVVDDPRRENEGDLIIAAEDVTTEQMAFLVRHSSGIICAPLLPARAARLGLPPMVADNEDVRGTAYTLTVDAADDVVTTGISAHDRALTCRRLADDDAVLAAVAGSGPSAFRRPGHVLPLQARLGGVCERRGHTEAAVDFCRLAGKRRVAVISELVDDGDAVPGQAIRTGSDMLRADGCIAFARTWGLKACTIADLVAYLEQTRPQKFAGPQEDEA
ncbi:dihydroxy-2-butanone 4-phosphate synthase [Grosmannia clavigera kw1407]|uniref:3,4-dihydroxy-2-butanone 4-phosphate synthase n=1 Tax=Grosmannia clavigera (strain kw1407 / UAMH 11150) TaxID=655863 RepID=F0XGB8_GROCL|nr:dihydroxy-2-butanone 4-phosphate synthase [Grosmannia clavigera kw1407]EFX03335.1 dihydroxy-2-butanone 4-phosphate synthase [Grosmannia clavigera kw1407]